jgi:hypothetical protein
MRDLWDTVITGIDADGGAVLRLFAFIIRTLRATCGNLR